MARALEPAIEKGAMAAAVERLKNQEPHIGKVRQVGSRLSPGKVREG
jgi:hypothetical protein